MYHTLMKRQLVGLFNDRSKIEMGKIIPLKSNGEFDFFPPAFFWLATSHLINFVLGLINKTL